jgi:hypothetical protein
MEHVHRILELCHVDYPPFAQNMNANFLNPASDGGQRLPIARLQSALNCVQIKSRGPAGLVREIAKIIQA